MAFLHIQFNKLRHSRLFQLFLIQIVLLLFLGVWAVSGSDFILYQGLDPNHTTNLHLPMGTYRAYITYSSSFEENAGTFISDSNSPYFKADTLQFYSWEHVDYLQLWSLKDMDDIRFVYNHAGGDLQIVDISIASTGEYRRILWVLALFLMGLGDITLLWVRSLISQFKVDKKEGFHGLARSLFLILTFLISCYPLAIDWFIASHDLPFHLARIEGLKEGLLSGQFPVRIQPTWFEGAGYPVSIMYGDILLYFSGLLRIMGFSLQTALKLYIVFLSAGTIACTYYALMSLRSCGITVKKWPAAIATAIYTLALYRLGDVYIRQSLGEYTAILFFPLVLCGMYNLLHCSSTEKGPYKWIMPSLGMVGILTCHAISSVIMALVLALWFLLEYNRVFSRQVLLNLIKTVVATVLLSLGFLLPFMDYYVSVPMVIHSSPESMSHIQEAGYVAEDMLGLQFHGTNCKVFGGVAVFLSVVLLLLFFATLRSKQTKENPFITGKLFVLLGLTMWLQTAWFPWDSLADHWKLFSILSRSIQFPWRFAGIAMMLIALLFTLICSQQSLHRWVTIGILWITALVIPLSALGYEHNILEHNNRYRIYDAAGLGLFVSHGTFSTFIVCGGEYLPLTEPDLMEYRFATTYSTGDISAELIQRSGARLTYQILNNEEQPRDLSVPLLYYKGYQALDPDTGMSYAVHSGHNGMSTITLPPGYSGRITIYFQSPWYWRLGEFISFLMILFYGGLFFKRRTKGPLHLTTDEK